MFGFRWFLEQNTITCDVSSQPDRQLKWNLRAILSYVLVRVNLLRGMDETP